MEITNNTTELIAETEDDKDRLRELKNRIEEKIPDGSAKGKRYSPTKPEWVNEEKTVLRVYDRLLISFDDGGDATLDMKRHSR